MGSADGQETLRFLLLGKTGSGKSSTGNTILGQDLFDADVSFVSVTDECQLKSASNHGVTLEVMDCPGLFDTGKTNTQVAERVMAAFSQFPGTDVICYVVEVGGYTEEDYAAYQRLRAMLEEKVTNHLLLLFTHGDRLKDKAITTILQTAPACLQRVLQECGHRYVVFNNSTSSAARQEQVQQLVQTARQMKTRNGDQLYTCPSYVSSQLHTELAARFDRVDQSEADRSLYVHRLQARLGQAQQNVSVQQQELVRKAQESEGSFKKREQTLQQQVDDLNARLSQQQLNNSSVTSQLQQLQNRLTQEQQQRQQELQQLQSQHVSAIQQKNAEIANIR